MNLPSTRLALRRSVLSESLADFAEHYWPVLTGMALVRNRAIDEVIAVLQRVADGELWRVLIAMPPGVGKSTMLALYAAWRFARNPAHRAIHMMHASSLSETESRRVRRLVESDEFREMFPAVCLRDDESTVAAWATTSDGRYFAVGRDSALLGRRALEAVVDDPADVADRYSPAEKAALWAWFGDSLMTRLDGDRAPVIVVHQRTGLDDLIGKLLAEEPGVWHLCVLPAEFEDGTLLAPNVLSREKLDGLKKRPRSYKTMYLQAPDGDDGSIARSAWRFHAIAEANHKAPRPMGCAPWEDAPTEITPTEFDATCISIDPTFGGTKSANDFAAIQVWSSVGPRRFLRARWTKKASQREQREQMKLFNEEYPGSVMLIEKSAGGAGLIEELFAENITNIIPVIPRDSKAARLDTVSPTIDNGLVHLQLGMVDLAEFVECLAGATAHDDDQDAASMAIHWLNSRVPQDAAVGGFTFSVAS